jgi:hypothetical protein
LDEIPGKTAVSEERAAPGAAVDAENGPSSTDPPALVDPQLAAIIIAWPQLSNSIRAGILALVNAAKQWE